MMRKKVDWYARDVAHIVLEDVQGDVGDGLDDFAVAQADGSSTREVCVGDFTTLNNDAAREFEDGVCPGLPRSRESRRLS